MKTNPDYARIAYRRAIIGEIISGLRNDYMSLDSDEPAKVMQCAQVFPEDAEVPQSALISVVTELEQESEALRIELSKFELTKNDRGNLLGKRTENGRKRDGNRNRR